MTFGVVDKPKTKKALKELVEQKGADNVLVYDTSGFGNRGTIPLSQLKASDVIVGPDVESDRRWSANVWRGKIK